jgi:hypothetical protein
MNTPQQQSIVRAELTRDDILNPIRTALEPLDYVYAVWEGGAAAFRRVDEWSDIDLMVDVEDNHVADAVSVIESVLTGLSPLTARYELPQPTWHGHWQAFYQLERASPFLLIDLAIVKNSSREKFIQQDIHGDKRVHFDKKNVLAPLPFPAQTTNQAIRARVAELRSLYPMFQTLARKEINRANGIEAIAFYQSWTLRPLLEVLRIRHCPQRWNFATRYAHYDLPAEVVQRLQPLYFVRDLADLSEKHAEAGKWCIAELDRLDLDATERTLSAL